MKIIFLLAGLTLFFTNTSFGQTKSKSEVKAEAKIIALEKEAWTAWKNNDPSWVKANSVENFLSANPDGVKTKAEVMASIPVDCKVKSFSLDEFAFRMLNKKTAALTYIARAEGMCGDEKIPAKARAGVTYVKQGGRWYEGFYMDAPINK